MKRLLAAAVACALIGGFAYFLHMVAPGSASAQLSLRNAGRSPSNVAARALTADTATSSTSATTATTASNLSSTNTATAATYIATDAGTAAAPAFSLGASNNGMYLVAANQPAISAGNTKVVDFETNSINAAVRIVMAAAKPIWAATGTAVAPSYSFGVAQATGFHLATTDIVGLSSGLQMNAPATAQPACGVSIRGTIWYTAGGVGVADVLELCAHKTDNTYAWVPFTAVP